MDGQPNDIDIGRAWVLLGKVKEALGELAPNHPRILE
jgi:hypothetical protein